MYLLVKNMSLNEIKLSLKWACYTLEFSLASITFGQVVWCPSGVLVNLWWCNCIHWWAKGPKVDLVVCLYPSPTLAYPYKVPLFPFVLSLSPFDRVPLGVWRWGYTSTLVSEPRSSVSIPSSKHSPIYKKLIPTRVTAWVLAWVWKNDLRPLWRIVSS